VTALSVFAAASEEPDRLAVLAGPTRLSFRELARRTQPYASALLQARPKALALTPRADLPSLYWLYAAFATGVPVLGLHVRATEPERQQAMALAQASLPPPLSTRAFDQAELPNVASENPLAFLSTSGSTGTPRLAQLSRRAVLASAAASAKNLGWQEDDRWLLCLPMAHAGGLSIVLRALVARRSLVLFDAGRAGLLSSVPALAERILDSGTTLLSLVPSLLDGLLVSGFAPSKHLRAVLLGGSGCSPALARRAESVRLPLLTSYGLTETSSQVVTRRYAERFAPLAEQDGCVSSGHALPGVELELRGGLIAIRAPSLFSGYLGEPSKNLDADGWLLTTDLGALSADGSLVVRGRLDDVIVTAGENVDPLEVEFALLQLPGVRAACVFGIPSARFGQVVGAALVCVDASLTRPDVLARLLGDHLARHKLPRCVAQFDSLPVTDNGKPDRRACAARFAHFTEPQP